MAVAALALRCVAPRRVWDSMRKASQGGWTVIESLRSVGLDVDDLPGNVAIAESGSPGLRPPRTVLFQNAWTVLPPSELRSQLEGELARRKFREFARRGVSYVNARRAHRLLALTHYMADLVQNRTGRKPEVVSVGTSLDLFSLEGVKPTELRGLSPFALIPGSLQRYKRPAHALEYVAGSEFRERISSVVFAGLRSDPGIEGMLTRTAEEVGLHAIFLTLRRPEIKWAYENCEVTVLASQLESLGFGLGEALYFAPRVVASSIPAHIEVAKYLNAEPMWMEGSAADSFRPAALGVEALRAGWSRLGEALLL